MGKLTVTFDIDAAVSDAIDDYAYKTKIEMRRRGVKSTKWQLIQYWAVKGMDEFDIDGFQDYLQQNNTKYDT